MGAGDLRRSTGWTAGILDRKTRGGRPRMKKDYLWLQMIELPYFRALLRAVEAPYYEDFTLPSPVLDIGCGDGHFAKLVFDRKIDVGIDPWHEPIQEARKYEGYESLIECDGSRIPVPDGYFSSAFSNSVLEHIPHVQVSVLRAQPALPNRVVDCAPVGKTVCELVRARVTSDSRR
jgi:SAM-dependent methyltransferase